MLEGLQLREPEGKSSRRLGIMYFIMISQQNCNLQQAMSHTTPLRPRSHPHFSSARSFSLLRVHFLCFPLARSPTYPPFCSVLSVSPTRSLSFSLSLSSVAPSRFFLLVESHGRCPAHTCEPSLTSDSKGLSPFLPASSHPRRLSPSSTVSPVSSRGPSSTVSLSASLSFVPSPARPPAAPFFDASLCTRLTAGSLGSTIACA